MHPKALVLLAEGAEEMEVVITVDVLRRGGVEVHQSGLLIRFPDLYGRHDISRWSHVSQFRDETWSVI
jgi:putative intracellular protease/amidase